MLLSLLFALALQSAPAATDPPVVAPPQTPPVAAEPTDIPHGAPTDDYGFVAWCRGALSGHMELYPSVKPEMKKLEQEKAAKEDARYTTDAQREAAVKRRAKEQRDDDTLDEQQLAAGKMYLKLYTEALDAAEAASAANLRKRGEEAQDMGFRIWSAARGAEDRTRMWSWIMWELPARCETAARRLKESSSLMAGVLKRQPVAETTVAAATPAAEAAPASTAAASEPSAETAAASPTDADTGLRLRSFSPRTPKFENATPPSSDAAPPPSSDPDKPSDAPAAPASETAPQSTAPADPPPASTPASTPADAPKL